MLANLPESAAAGLPTPPPGTQQLVYALATASVLLVILAIALLRLGHRLREQRRVSNAALADPNLILDNLPDPVWFKDPDGVYLACNPAMERLHGARATDIVGRTDFDLMDVDAARAARRGDRAAIAAGDVMEAQAWVTFQADGRSVYLQIMRRPLFDDTGHLLGVLSVGRDITDLHEAKHALRLRESYQQALLDNFPFEVWLKDTEGRYLAANRPFAEAAGLESPRAIVNRTDHELWPGPRADALCAEDRQVLDSRHRQEAETRLEDDAGVRWLETYRAPVLDDNHQLLGTVGFARDVTERHEMETALRESEGRFRHFFDNTSLVVLLVDPASGTIIDANPAAALFYGYPGERLAGMAIAAINTLPPGQVTRACDEAARGQRNHFRFEHRLADGSLRSVEVYSTPVVSGGRELLYSVVQDVTERQRAERALADERHRLQSVIEGTRVGTWEWNVQTGETRFNERWAEITGYALDELQPVSIDTWMRHAHPDDLAASGRLLEQHFAGESDFYDCEARMRHRDGHWIWVHDRGKVFEWDDDGKPLWMAGTHQDITERKLAEAALRESEQRLRIAGETAFDLIYEWDPGSERMHWFGDVAGCLGYPPSQVGDRLEDWRKLIHPDDRPGLVAAVERHAREGQPYDYSYRVRHADGSYRHWVDKASPLLDGKGRPGRWIGVCADVTAQHQVEEQQRLAATVFQHAREGIMITDAEARIIDVNEAFTGITGYSRYEALGRNPRFLASGTHDAAFYQEMWEGLARADRWVGEIWNRRKNGEKYAETLSITAVRDGDGEVMQYVALFSDITLQKLHQQELERIAYYDTLTDLPNRRLLGDRLEHAMQHALRHKNMVAVVYMDLDGFKAVNDAFGHDVGDQLLVQLARRFRQALRGDDTVARLGGDEFVAVLGELDSAEDCYALLPRLLEVASQPLDHDGHLLKVSASLGVTLYPQAADTDADQLLRQADQAMYQAKLDGKNRFHFFDADHDRSVRDRVEIVEQVGEALASGGFTLHLQPKVNMRSGEVIGAEALIRWPLADGGVRRPAEFLPLIEQHQLSIELDRWVMGQALDQLAAWQDDGLALELSINVSAYHLQHGDFIASLQDALGRQPGVAPGRLTVEILETTALMDLGRISSVIRAGQALGVRFALDDFGTGYSSLDYLKNLPTEQLKIDRGFVRDMLDDRDDLAILEGIMGLATAFRRTPVAEGVESIEHGEILLQLGCEIAQGYGIARPMPAAEMACWMADWRPPPEWRRQQRIDHEDLPLVFAMVEHRSWVKQVCDVIRGEAAALPPTDENLCNFGIWLNRDAVRRYGSSDVFREVRALHHQVHETAGRLLAIRDDGRVDEARARLPELTETRDRLVDRLKRLLQYRAAPGTDPRPERLRSSG